MRTALVAGGLGVMTLIGALFVYNHKRTIDQIPRQKVLATAKALRQQMFLSMVQLSNFVKQNASRVPPQHIKTYVLDQQGQHMKNFKQKLSKVFVEFSQEDFQENINKFYKQDAQVQYHLKRYQQQFEKSILGVTPEFRQEIVTFLSPEKVLSIIKDLLQAKLVRIKSKIKQKITFQQMVIILRAQKQEQKQLRSSKLKQIGLVGKDDQLASIFQFAVAKYCKMDDSFRQKYQQMMDQYKVHSNQHVDRFCSFPRSTSKASINSLKSLNAQQRA